MIKLGLGVFLIALIICLVLSPLIFWFVKKIGARQTILHYVEEHKGKSGTPTMGGIMFVFATIFASSVFLKTDISLSLLALCSMVAYSSLGFIDDFIKIRFKQNLGLRAYQKVIGQLGIALIIATYAYMSNLVGGTLYVPFVNTFINLSWGIIPLSTILMVSIVNSVNLLDGLDGLCSGVSTIYSIGFGILTILIAQRGLTGVFLIQQQNLAITLFAMGGALFGFLLLNSYPAKIFMGDTGSLAIGGIFGACAVLSRLTLLVPLLGVVFVITALSDIIQVLHYKRTKKRIFLMAPLHHHFQKKGFHENKIAWAYSVLTAVVFALTILFI